MLSRKITQSVGRLFATTKALSILSLDQKEAYLRKIEENARMDYKKYPFFPHQDPSSPEYIESELDEYRDEVEVRAYNTIIDNFKNDLKVQREVWDSINNLDRPYKRGTPGLHTNLDPNGLAQPKLEDIGFPRRNPSDQKEFTFANEDRFIANTPFHYDLGYKHIYEWENLRRNRPVTKHYNHGKGYKYDVEVKYEDRYEYVADRLGHPQFLGTPIQWLLRLENDIYHPNYLDQPFVQQPSPKPHPSLNFQQGEVIYENTNVLEWVKFWQAGVFTLGGFGALWVPFNLAFKTNLVTDGADELLFVQYHLSSPANIDILRIGIPVAVGSIFYAVYIMLNFTNKITKDYVVKMSYSKDKELVFVKRVDLHGRMQEDVYETAHLEIIPPSHKSGVSHLSSYDDDGLWRVTCLNSRRTMLLYNDKRHWNSALRLEFLKNTTGMWDKSYYGYNRNEAAENERRFREDIEQTFTQEALPKN